MILFANYWAVIVAAIVGIAIGFVWYGPLLGRTWVALSGISSDYRPRILNMLLMVVGILAMSLILDYFVTLAASYTYVTGIGLGLTVGFWSWLGFIFPASLASVVWEGKSWKLWLINSGYYLVTLLVMACILAIW